MSAVRWPGRVAVTAPSPADVAESLRRQRDGLADGQAPEQVVDTTPPITVVPDVVEPDPGLVVELEALRARVEAARLRSAEAVAAVAGAAVMSPEEARFEAWFLDRQLREAEAEAKAAQRRREEAAIGGPCRFCGIVRSWYQPRPGGPRYGRWYEDHAVCWECEQTRTDKGRTRLGDLEHRETVLASLMPPWVGRVWWPGPLTEKLGRFCWWSETPGAASSETRRFAYVDVDGLVARLVPEPPTYETRDPCPRCGVPSRWSISRVPANTNASGFGPTSMVSLVRCAAPDCNSQEDFVWFVCRMTGLSRGSVESLGLAAAVVLGVHWWADDPAGGAADPPKPAASAYAYLDRGAACRRALDLFPDPRRWRSLAAMERARELAAGR